MVNLMGGPPIYGTGVVWNSCCFGPAQPSAQYGAFAPSRLLRPRFK